MKKLTGIIIALMLIAVLVVAGCNNGTSNSAAPAAKTAQKQTIKIGVVVPLSGDLAFLGEGVRDAMLLAKENLGSTKYNYELIFEDDRLDPKLTASATKKLVGVNNVNAVVSISSGTGNVVTPIAESAGVIHFGIASDANVAKGKYNFIHWTTPEEEARVFVEEAERRGIKRVAIIQMNHQGEEAITQAVKEFAAGTDVEIVAISKFNGGDKDFKTAILKAKAENPEIYMLLAFSPEIELITKQIKELGIKEPVTSIEAFELTDQPQLFEGQWYVNAADPTAEFQDSFQRKFGGNPTLGAANAYDIFNLIVAAFERAGTDPAKAPSNEQAATALGSISSFNGVLGKLSVSSDGLVDSKAVVRKIENGKPVTVRG